MARKHEVDPTTQGSLLAPSPGSLAVAQTVEIDGGYYHAPETPETPLSPEQEALKAESQAIFLLGKAADTKRTITNMEKYQHNLKNGRVREGTDVERELARLARRDEKGNPIGAIPTSRKNYRFFRRQAKIAFAESVGIETVSGAESRLVEGVPQEVIIVKAQNPQEQTAFVEGFRQFDKRYGQAGRSATAARQKRRQEIEALI